MSTREKAALEQDINARVRFDTPTPFEEWDPEEKAAKMKIEQLELQLKGAQMEHDGLRLQRLAQLGELM